MQIGQSGTFLEAFNTARAAAYDIFQVIFRKSPIDSCSNEGQKPSNMIGQISFKKVLFNYPARKDVKILNGLDLEIDPGKTVALVGPSGCGKSTCVQLIQRFYDPDQGNLSKGIVNKTIKGQKKSKIYLLLIISPKKPIKRI